MESLRELTGSPPTQSSSVWLLVLLWEGMADAKLTFQHGVEILKRDSKHLCHVTKTIRSIGVCHKCFEAWHNRFCI